MSAVHNTRMTNFHVPIRIDFNIIIIYRYRNNSISPPALLTVVSFFFRLAVGRQRHREGVLQTRRQFVQTIQLPQTPVDSVTRTKIVERYVLLLLLFVQFVWLIFTTVNYSNRARFSFRRQTDSGTNSYLDYTNCTTAKSAYPNTFLTISTTPRCPLACNPPRCRTFSKTAPSMTVRPRITTRSIRRTISTTTASRANPLTCW